MRGWRWQTPESLVPLHAGITLLTLAHNCPTRNCHRPNPAPHVWDLVYVQKQTIHCLTTATGKKPLWAHRLPRWRRHNRWHSVHNSSHRPPHKSSSGKLFQWLGQVSWQTIPLKTLYHPQEEIYFFCCSTTRLSRGPCHNITLFCTVGPRAREGN